MKLRENESEILKLFAEQAEKDGLVKADKPKTEELYNLKPNGDEDILQKAHPKPVVVSPAYDKLNGLVENLQERHKIMVEIAKKPNHGRLTEFLLNIKAYNDLNDSLIKAAFLLDRDEQEDLMVVADESICQLEKVGAGLVLPIAAIVLPIAAILGGMIYTGNNPASQGFKNDLAKAITEVKDCVTNDYPQMQKAIGPFLLKIQQVSSQMDEFIKLNDEITNAILQIKGATTDDEKKKAIVQNTIAFIGGGKFESKIKQLESFKDSCKSLIEMLPIAITEFKNADQKYESDDWAPWRAVKETWRGMVADSDAIDAYKALLNVQKSIGSVFENVDKQISALQELKASVEVYSPEVKKEQEVKQETAPTEKKPSPERYFYVNTKK